MRTTAESGGDRVDASKKIPGPSNVHSLGNLFRVRHHPLNFFVKMHRDYGDYVALKFGTFRFLLVDDPEGVRRILVDNHRNYPKSKTYMALKLVLGEGLLTSEGDFWRRQRRLAQPAFHKERLASFARTMVSDTTAMLDRWRRENAGPAFDLHREMMALTFRIVNRTLFSTDTGDDAEAVGQALPIVIDYVNEAADSLVRLPTWLPTPKNIRFNRAKRTLDAVVLRIIDERRRSRQREDDLLSMLMSAEDEETREQMTDRQLRDEIMTLVLAGHETTANALTWTFYLLAQHPAVAERLRKEVHEVIGDREPTVDDLARLPFTRMVLEESMRLFPPAWEFERRALADDTLGGYHVPRGTTVAMCPYTLHRNPAYWENPETFDPDRFAPEHAARRPKYAYLPFGGGARLCIGNGFAMMEAQIILAMIASRYTLDLAPGFEVELEPTITLRPKAGLFMIRKPRSARFPDSGERVAQQLAHA